MFEGSSRNGAEQIDRDGLYSEFFESKGEFDAFSIVSPMQIIPPQQMSMPTCRAARRVVSFCSCVWVEQSRGK